MSFPIITTTGVTASGVPRTASASQATSTSQVTGTSQATNGQLDRDTFLKLLVAQLKYQDPSAPVDSSQFMAQTAQFTMVEKLSDIAASQQLLLTTQAQFGASNLVGRTVAYLDETNKIHTGVVSAVKYGGVSPILRVGNTDVPLSSVTEVQTTAG